MGSFLIFPAIVDSISYPPCLGNHIRNNIPVLSQASAVRAVPKLYLLSLCHLSHSCSLLFSCSASRALYWTHFMKFSISTVSIQTLNIGYSLPQVFTHFKVTYSKIFSFLPLTEMTLFLALPHVCFHQYVFAYLRYFFCSVPSVTFASSF